MALITKNGLPEFTGNIIDLFEDFLEEKGIQIENDEREGDEGEAIIYGSDYGILILHKEAFMAFFFFVIANKEK